MTESIPRPEYPRPQFVRDDWLCLNGEWQFEIDPGDSGLERGLAERELSGRIIVPFCPESTLSGIGNTDWMNAVWYRRTITIPPEWAGRNVLLHFQAVDYDATVWVNGVEVARHRGGFTPITCDLTGIAQAGQDATIVVRARDPRGGPKPSGKQSPRYENYGCMYTRTTGIWQTVWMEPVPDMRLGRPRITPDVGRGQFRVQAPVVGAAPGAELGAVLRDRQGIIAMATCRLGSDLNPTLDLLMPEDRRRLWSPADPFLYHLDVALGGSERHRRGSGDLLRGAARDQHPGAGHQAERGAALPAAGARSGLLPRRHPDRADRRGAAPRHRAEHGRRLQRRAAASEGVRGALPLPRRPAGLPGVGRVRRLGLQRLRAGRRQPAAGRDLHHAMAGGAGARLLASVDHRLVPAERDVAAHHRPHHRPG